MKKKVKPIIRELGSVLRFPQGGSARIPEWDGVIVSVNTSYENGKMATIYSVVQYVRGYEVLGLGHEARYVTRIVRADFKGFTYIKTLSMEEMLVHDCGEVRALGTRFAEDELEP